MHPYLAFLSFGFILLLSCPAGSLALRALKPSVILPRPVVYLLGPAAAALLHLFYYESAWAVFKEQNWTRLQRTVAMAMGFPLYPDPETGPAMTTIYGPVSALAYWPASWADTPGLAVRCGAAISMLFFFAPMFLVTFTKDEEEKRAGPYRTLAFFCFAFLASFLTSTKEAAFTIHADAPALGLGLAACACVYGLRKASEGRIFLSAALAVLATGAKQTAVPLLPAIALYLLFSSGRRAFLLYALGSLVSGTAALLLMAAFFDLRSVFFYVIYLPSLHPAKEGGAEMILESLWRLSREALAVAAAMLPGLVPALAERRKAGLREWLGGNPWALYAWAGLWMAPIALASHMKIGGSSNTYSFVTYFLLAAAAALLVRSAARGGKGMQPTFLPGGRAALGAYFCILVLFAVPKLCLKIIASEGRPDFGKEAYAYALANPGEAYFPRMPLVTLMSEKKLYHSADGLMDRQWAGLPVTGDHFRAHIPPALSIIAFSGEDHRSVLPLEGFVVGYTDTAFLPSFVVYPKEEALIKGGQ